MIIFKTGDTYYFLENSHRVVEGTTQSCAGGNYIVKYGQGKDIRLSGSRLYKTLEGAETAMPRKIEARRRIPYDYM